MSTTTDTRTVVVERDLSAPPEKLWRALTEPLVIAEWLMQTDFAPTVGLRFKLSGDWGGVLDGEVLEVEPPRRLSYTWNYRPRRRRLRPPQHGDLHAHPDARRHPPAHGTVGLPAGPETGFGGASPAGSSSSQAGGAPEHPRKTD